MDIIHGMNENLPRFVMESLEQRLRVMPAVVVTGARQTGKSTLVRDLTPGDRRYVSLDDLDAVDVCLHNNLHMLARGQDRYQVLRLKYESDII